jgi:hypothetical protein
LSNVYKLISRAVNNRLNSIVKRISNHLISHYNSNNIRGAVVAVDMAKSLDTLSQSFLHEVFMFFDSGPNIARWYWDKTEKHVLHSSMAHTVRILIWEEVEPRVTTSPQMVLSTLASRYFKTELNSNITGVWRLVLRPLDLTYVPISFLYESSRVTSKNEVRADDNTTIIKLDTKTC